MVQFNADEESDEEVKRFMTEFRYGEESPT